MATAIIQARMGSTRLPGKVLKNISGKPLIAYIIETLKLSPVVDDIIIATSKKSENDKIEAYAESNNIKCFRGSENNVLERFYEVSVKYPDKNYFRATADNPILDIRNPEKSLNFLKKNNLEYAAVKGMPIGTILECFTREALKKTYLNAVSEEDKEHVTLYMKKSKDFKIGFLDAEKEIYFPDMRLTVDYPEDFERVEKIISILYNNGIPNIEKIIAFVNSNSNLN